MATHPQVESSVFPENQLDRARPLLRLKGYHRLVERAVDIFGDEIKASRWLSSPSADFNGRIPLEVAQQLEYREQDVTEMFEPVFLRIEHGIYL